MTTKTELRTRIDKLVSDLIILGAQEATGVHIHTVPSEREAKTAVLTLLEDTVRAELESLRTALRGEDTYQFRPTDMVSMGIVEEIFDERLVELKEQGSASSRQAERSPNTKLNNGGQ